MAFAEQLEDSAAVSGRCDQPGFRHDARRDYAGRALDRRVPGAAQGGSHEIFPDRQCGAAAFFPRAERAILIEADPRGCDDDRH